MFIMWSSTEEIGRPKRLFEYAPLKGCHKDRQFMAFRHEVVAARPYACWCDACCKMVGPGNGMDSGCKDGSKVLFSVPGCVGLASAEPMWAKWKEVPVHRVDSAGVGAYRKAAQAAGLEVAKKAEVDQYVAAQTHDDHEDQYAIGVFVDAGDGTPIVKRITAASEVIDGTRHYKDDVILKLIFILPPPLPPSLFMHIYNSNSNSNSVDSPLAVATSIVPRPWPCR
jgi:hypothetical protein